MTIAKRRHDKTYSIPQTFAVALVYDITWEILVDNEFNQKVTFNGSNV